MTLGHQELQCMRREVVLELPKLTVKSMLLEVTMLVYSEIVLDQALVV